MTRAARRASSRPTRSRSCTELQREFGAAAARAARRTRRARRSGCAPASCPDFLPETRAVREGDWRVAPAPAGPARPPRRDHRPGRPQDGDQRAQLRREGLHGRLRGRELADLGERDRGPAQPHRRGRPDDPARARARSSYELNDEIGDAARAPARLAPASSSTSRSTARRCRRALFDFGLYFFRNASARARGTGPYFYLPKLESHLEARLWNDVFVLRAGRARACRAARSGRRC